MPNKFDTPMSIKTGSFNRLISSICDIADLKPFGTTKHGHKSYSTKSKSNSRDDYVMFFVILTLDLLFYSRFDSTLSCCGYTNLTSIICY